MSPKSIAEFFAPHFMGKLFAALSSGDTEGAHVAHREMHRNLDVLFGTP